MKTLEQLWRENGEKGGFKVMDETWPKGAWFLILGRKPNGLFLGYDEEGETIELEGRGLSFELYVEPKPKRVIELEEWVWTRGPYGGQDLMWFKKGEKPGGGWIRTGETRKIEVECE